MRAGEGRKSDLLFQLSGKILARASALFQKLLFLEDFLHC